MCHQPYLVNLLIALYVSELTYMVFWSVIYKITVNVCKHHIFMWRCAATDA